MGAANLLIIGAGGASRAASVKCAINSGVFTKITLASHTKSECDTITSFIRERLGVNVETAEVDADNVEAVITLIQKTETEILLDLALSYQDLSLMDAYLETGIHYIGTANCGHPDLAKFGYKKQWARDESFRKVGILGLLGSGFDPGITNVFCAYAKQNLFDEIHYIGTLDCNAGDHDYTFATGFNPEVSLRKVSAKGRYFESGKWIETEPMEIKMEWDCPEVDVKDSYLLYHKELESLVKNIPSLKRIRFFMAFGRSCLMHMKYLENVDMLGTKPVKHKGVEIVPVEFLRAPLPDPASLGERTKGYTNIGCMIRGAKDGKDKQIYIYNVCNHEECFKETLSQTVSYTTGVPAMIGAKLVTHGIWSGVGIKNMEGFDAEPFVDELNSQGLPWKILKMKPDLGD